MKIRPVGGKVLLRIIPAKAEEVVGGIVVRGRDSRDGCREAIVEAVPQGYRGDLMPGDMVVAPAYCGHEARINGAHYLFVKPEELQAAIE